MRIYILVQSQNTLGIIAVKLIDHSTTGFEHTIRLGDDFSTASRRSPGQGIVTTRSQRISCKGFLAGHADKQGGHSCRKAN